MGFWGFGVLGFWLLIDFLGSLGKVRRVKNNGCASRKCGNGNIIRSAQQNAVHKKRET